MAPEAGRNRKGGGRARQEYADNPLLKAPNDPAICLTARRSTWESFKGRK